MPHVFTRTLNSWSRYKTGYKGCLSKVLFRAMVVNAAQLATYSQAKQFILATGYIKVIYRKTVLRIRFILIRIRPKIEKTPNFLTLFSIQNIMLQYMKKTSSALYKKNKVRHMLIYYITILKFQNSIDTTIREFYI